jgi:hypothetical protein
MFADGFAFLLGFAALIVGVIALVRRDTIVGPTALDRARQRRTAGLASAAFAGGVLVMVLAPLVAVQGKQSNGQPTSPSSSRSCCSWVGADRRSAF